MAPSRIQDLAYSILANTIKFDEVLESRHEASPSFDVSTFTKLPESQKLLEAQTAIVEAISELQALVLGPMVMLRSLGLSYINLISLQAIYQFGIAQSFDEKATYEQISKKCGLSEQTLCRIMRHAMTNHIFKEEDGVITHTAASKLLNENPLMRAWIGMICQESWPAATQTVNALERWPDSQEPEHTGFAIAKGTDLPFFKVLGKDPVRAKRFAEAMSMFESSQGSGSAIATLLEHYPWANLGNGTVIDVGGSHGSRAIAIAREFPSLNCVVLDLPEVVAGGPSQVPNELQTRVTFSGHDFFTDAPDIAKGADLFLFCRVFHNWSDKYCVKILRSLLPALKHGARILITDICIPKPNVLGYVAEQKMRSSDLGMMTMLNARERERDEWAKLLQEADPRFQLVGVTKPPGSQMSFIEACWEVQSDIDSNSTNGFHPSEQQSCI